MPKEKTRQNTEEGTADDEDDQTKDTAIQVEEPAKRKRKHVILGWIQGQQEEPEEVKEQTKEKASAVTKRKYEILERHKDEHKVVIARAVGSKKQKKPKAKL